MYIASDLLNGAYRITGKFTGKDALAVALRWAGTRGKVTRIVKPEIFASLKTGKSLPKRYVH